MKYGVVVVTYNRFQLLKECLDAIAGQMKKFEKVVIIDNHSMDDTEAWLETNQEANWVVKRLESNTGGAGGFCEGVKLALEQDLDWIVLIDDDAILDHNFLNSISTEIETDETAGNFYPAYAGTVKTKNEIVLRHRTRVGKYIYRNQDVKEKEYNKHTFLCDFASFCGICISRQIILKIGYPDKEYFIWNDDAEYSMRLRKYGKIKNVNAAGINHKTELVEVKKVNWKTYYGVRNRINMVKRHYGRISLFYVIMKAYGAMLLHILKNRENSEFIKKVFTAGVMDGVNEKLGKKEDFLP